MLNEASEIKYRSHMSCDAYEVNRFQLPDSRIFYNYKARSPYWRNYEYEERLWFPDSTSISNLFIGGPSVLWREVREFERHTP